MGQPVPKLLDLLKEHEQTTREFARRELQQRSPEAVIAHLDEWVAALDPSEADYEHHAVEALWVRQGLNAVDAHLLKRLLSAKHAGARIAATQVLRFCQDRIDGSFDLIASQIHDRDPRVRLHAVLASGFTKSENAIETALGVADHKIDPGLKHALGSRPIFSVKVPDRVWRFTAWSEREVAFSSLPFLALFHQDGGH